MHELGLMTGVMDAAVEAAREAGATRLLGVRELQIDSIEVDLPEE